MIRTFTFPTKHLRWGHIAQIEFSYRLNPKYDGHKNTHKFLITELKVDGFISDASKLSWNEQETLKMQIEHAMTDEERTVLKMREDRGSPKLLDFFKKLVGCKA